MVRKFKINSLWLRMGLIFFLAIALIAGVATPIQPAGENQAKIINEFSTSTVPSNEVSLQVPSNDNLTPVNFDVDRALDHMKHLSVNIGPRPAGGRNERLASEYIKEKLDALGYNASIQKFVLPNKQHSCNIVAFLPGRDRKSIIFGAHIDSKGGPGANDNASGVGVLLELARVAGSHEELPYSLYFVFFGAEEKLGKSANQHHFGSRHYVSHMSKEQKSTILAMINVDMVGVGSKFHARSLKTKPGPVARNLLKLAGDLNIALSYKQAKAIGDFEAFEKSGVDSAWLQWRKDPNYHSPGDTYVKINRKNITAVGTLLQESLLQVDVCGMGPSR
ncbi:MAG: M28 family peptidase [Actinobacteria bacterium]|nr:M28 family peptidase [Actinomycetota bacterium]